MEVSAEPAYAAGSSGDGDKSMGDLRPPRTMNPEDYQARRGGDYRGSFRGGPSDRPGANVIKLFCP